MRGRYQMHSPLKCHGSILLNLKSDVINCANIDPLQRTHSESFEEFAAAQKELLCKDGPTIISMSCIE